ncbi:MULTISPECIES: Fpg/Nei family DNA glycosylase [Amycolatopsis]|uniref:DNA-(apurinic or apyrimidinic site) lyase n=1 Tax=Amycolatopsis thermalba TaxID=944492 RepID=A0ABY4NTL1_9PSEU|nr:MULTISPECIES: zinc finger domain-containing protein [Amycolatopsis]OXM66202.1 DNA glycosylase [Amycolatopsis sp. KNN50.9b]UQS23343.1 Fpg/Nei family DNA glycosylase [Amycolatopsis thermalba]
MPEGHTLHRLARLHQRRYAGAPVGVSSPQGRFASEAALLDGRVMLGAEAYGKHLFHDFGPLGSVHVHLGLYGTFTEAKLPETTPVGQVRLRLTGRTHWTDLRGPTRCELLTPDEVDAIKARLGPDPLRRDARPDEAWQRISASRTSIAALLMDQSVISGVGNVYRAEVLFRHRINPMVPGRALDHVQWKEMWTDLVALMRKGVRIGRIDTVDDEHLPEVTGRAPRQDRHGGEVYVYRRTGQPCLVCGTPVAHTELAGRNLYWCPVCQTA